MNACAADEGLRKFAAEIMADDLMRLGYIPGAMYNFHPESHVQQGPQVGIDKISELLNRVLNEEQCTVVLLETMAGKGSEVGRTFDEIRAIIDRTELESHLLSLRSDAGRLEGLGQVRDEVVNVLDADAQAHEPVTQQIGRAHV